MHQFSCFRYWTKHLIGVLVVDLGTEDIPLNVRRMFIMNGINRHIWESDSFNYACDRRHGEELQGTYQFFPQLWYYAWWGRELCLWFRTTTSWTEAQNKNVLFSIGRIIWLQPIIRLQRNSNEYSKASSKLETTEAVGMSQTRQNKMVNAPLQMKWTLSQHRNERERHQSNDTTSKKKRRHRAH